jgi:hypothetical protein
MPQGESSTVYRVSPRTASWDGSLPHAGRHRPQAWHVKNADRDRQRGTINYAKTDKLAGEG